MFSQDLEEQLKNKEELKQAPLDKSMDVYLWQIPMLPNTDQAKRKTNGHA